MVRGPVRNGHAVDRVSRSRLALFPTGIAVVNPKSADMANL